MPILRIVLCLATLLLFAAAGWAQSVSAPGPGSRARVAILDALRPAVEAEMRGPVKFLVTEIRASSKWAFVQAEPQRPDGSAVDMEDTAFAGQGDMMDGLTVYALMRFKGGRWSLVDHLVGPTDVGYMDWPERYGVPAAVLGLD